MDLKGVVVNAVAIHLQNVKEFFADILDSDDEDAIAEKNDNFVEIIVQNYNDKQFKEHFRMCPETFEYLLQQVFICNEDLQINQRGRPTISLSKQLLITLWCLSNTECFRSVADRFGVTKSTCWATLYKVCNYLLKVNIHNKIIAFPSGEKALETIIGFQNICGFPGVIGAIDGCHIRIDKPKEYPNSYINRKGYPSILLQGVCDHRKMFVDVYAGEAGSIHDSNLFLKSDLTARMRSQEVTFPYNSHLIGDLAYTLNNNMMVGFKDNGHLSQQQKYYNQKLSQTRVVIENAFGLLKMLETKRLDLIALLVVSACILHNICISSNDLINELFEEEDNIDHVVQHQVRNNPAIIKRNYIVNLLYQNRGGQ